jgi:hypothetical protein
MHEVAPTAVSVQGAGCSNPRRGCFDKLQDFRLSIIFTYFADSYGQDISRSGQGHENCQTIKEAKTIAPGHQALYHKFATVSGHHLNAPSVEADR